MLTAMAIRLPMEYNVTIERIAVHCIATQLAFQRWITILIKDCRINHGIPCTTILRWHRYTYIALTVHDVVHEQAEHLKHKRRVLHMIHTLTHSLDKAPILILLDEFTFMFSAVIDVELPLIEAK